MAEPWTTLVPLRVVEATRPPLNWPRATSYVLVTTRVARIASWGTDPDPKRRPSSVTALASARWPATEKAAAVLSVPPSATTPGTSATAR